MIIWRKHSATSRDFFLTKLFYIQRPISPFSRSTQLIFWFDTPVIICSITLKLYSRDLITIKNVLKLVNIKRFIFKLKYTIERMLEIKKQIQKYSKRHLK